MVKWNVATVTGIIAHTERTRSFILDVPGFGVFRPGQHVDIRLTAPDGYQAQRSYSIASAPAGGDEIELTVELLDDGEVSPYFHEVVREGDRFEVRGPIGGPFTWTESIGGPLLLAGGGSGVVPLMSMLRHRNSLQPPRPPASLLYSARILEEVIFREELEEMATASGDSFALHLTLTRNTSPDWNGFSRRVDDAMLRQVIAGLGEPAAAYVCGPTGFVESVANTLVEIGLPPADIRTERFGPSGT